jgi:hypothetical protein
MSEGETANTLKEFIETTYDPVVKLLALVFQIAVRDKVNRIVLSYDIDDGAQLFYDQHESIAPPRQLFRAMTKLCRRVARRAAKYERKIPVKIVYTDTGAKQTLEITLNHQGCDDLPREIAGMLCDIRAADDAKALKDKAERDRTMMRWGAAIAILAFLATIIIGSIVR